MDDLTSFGALVRQRRRALRLTQEELAAGLYCAPGTLRKIESDERRPSRELAERLAQVLQVPPDQQERFVRVARGELALDGLDLSADQPGALRPTTVAPATNLPVQRTRLIGRDDELEQICDLVLRDDIGLVTLTGPGGIGKTRLAQEAARRLLETTTARGPVFPDGVWFVDLAPLEDPHLVATAIATTLAIQAAAEQTDAETLTAALRTKKLLLVLDNFEQILPAAGMLGELLATLPRLRVLVTSRAALNLRAEHELAVSPLGLPDPTAQPSARRLSESAAVQLFVERGQQVRPSFAIAETTAPAIAEICRRLDGLPLALELAAARLRLFSPEAILQRLAEPLQFLTSGARDLPRRQQTLRATLEWSYHLLRAGEQHLLRCLSVFTGGWTLDAAAAVWPVPDGDDVLAGIQVLAENSLVRPLEEARGEPRFGMLETIRQYAAEQLHACGEVDEVCARHAGYMVRLAERAAPELSGARQVEWLARLGDEADNLRAAFEWLLEHDLGLCARLAAALPPWWIVRGQPREGRQWVRAVLERAPTLPPELRAMLLLGNGLLAWRDVLQDEAQACYAEARDLARGAGDTYAIARAMTGLAWVARYRGELNQACELGEESLAMLRAGGAQADLAEVLRLLGHVAEQANDDARAEMLLGESLALSRAGHDARGVAEALDLLAYINFRQGDRTGAEVLHRESRAIREALHDRAGIAEALMWLAFAASKVEDYAYSIRRTEEILALRTEIGDRRGVAHALHILGMRTISAGDSVLARAYCEQSLELYRELGLMADVAVVLNSLGILLGDDGEYAQARALLEESRALLRERGEVDPEFLLDSLARAALMAEDYERARAWFVQCLAQQRKRGELYGIECFLEGLGSVAAGESKTEDLRRAVRLWGVADALAETNRTTLTSWMGTNERRRFEQRRALVRSRLGDEDFAAAWAEGWAMTPAQAIAYALDEPTPETAEVHHRRRPSMHT